MPTPPLSLPLKPRTPQIPPRLGFLLCRRCFHDYFVTHLPSSSLHPDSRSSTGPHHKLPRSASTPHRDDHDSPPGTNGALPPTSRRSPAALLHSTSREMTVVRIPLRSAKHHFGSCMSRGTRPYNEDAFQAGTIEVPAFAKRRPISLTTPRRPVGPVGPQKESGEGEGTSADSASGDPQVFYFGVFDGHGGAECSEFLRDRLHEYVEEGAALFELKSSLKKGFPGQGMYARRAVSDPSKVTGKEGEREGSELAEAGKESLDAIEMRKQVVAEPKVPANGKKTPSANEAGGLPPDGEDPVLQSDNKKRAEELECDLVREWRNTVGGYFKRFKPQYFSVKAGGQGHILEDDAVRSKQLSHSSSPTEDANGIGMETVLTYAFLKADLDFIEAQVSKTDEDQVLADRALNADDILEHPSRLRKPIGNPRKRFQGGSTGSIAMVSTPTPTPFWHPASPSTLIASHAGDTRIILCNTSTGQAVPLTTNHHPSTPIEATRLRRYAATFVTDSFGEERMSGLANTRAFGDMSRKRLGISAEPEVRRIELSPAEYSFFVLCSDGVSGTLSDQEIVDIVKEAKTPEQGARDVVGFATEVGGGEGDADNATALVVRLGGWERRSEGGVGSLGTKEAREWRRRDAMDPRNRRT